MIITIKSNNGDIVFGDWKTNYQKLWYRPLLKANNLPSTPSEAMGIALKYNGEKWHMQYYNPHYYGVAVIDAISIIAPDAHIQPFSTVQEGMEKIDRWLEKLNTLRAFL